MESLLSPLRDKFIIRSRLVVCSLLIISIITIYYQSISFDFINYDTPQYVTENRPVLGGLTLQGIRWAFTAFYMSNWHPITWLSHMLDVEIYGLHPGGHRFTNILLHIINTLLLFYILSASTGSTRRSGLIAGLFALHPLHIQSVVWVAERKDLLSTFFFFLTILSYMHYLEKKTLFRYLGSLILFSLGLMSKPMIVTLPFVLLLMDYWPLQRISFQQKIPLSAIFDKIPLFLLAIASSIITIYAQKVGGAMAGLTQLPLTFRLENTFIAYVAYISKMFFPSNIAIIYPYPDTLSLATVISSFLLLAIITAITLSQVKNHPMYTVGWLWFLGTLVPVIGIIQVGRQSMADRYTYIPLIGLFIMISWGLVDFLKKYDLQKKLFPISVAIMLTAYSASTWKELGYWRNSITLFGKALEVTENNFIAHNNYGHALVKKYKFEEASKHFQKVIEINPNYGDGYLNYGLTLYTLNKPGEAIQQFQNGLRCMPNDPITHNHLANAFYRIGNNKQAIQHYLKAIYFKPDYAEAHNNLGAIMAREGKIELAIQHFKLAIHYNPNYQAAKNNLRNITAAQNIAQ